MAGIPTGTVTFLFTDIEGSTKLAREHPETWEIDRARHHRILREAIEFHQGYVFQIIGDAFCAAFHTAGDALRAAIKSQMDLNAEHWGDIPIQVRMGIHTGKAEIKENGEYHGYLAMSRVQRLMSSGHGGQVLISAAAQELLLEDLPDGVSLRDLGERRLKDLIRPEHIYQLIIPGLTVDFPPLKTLDFYRHNLPVQLTSFIGREKEMAEIKQSILTHRLITLTGVGGTGKTRLALQVAADVIDQFPDGVWFVDLAPITDPDLVSQIILSALGIPDRPGLTLQQQLLDFLHKKKLLLLLDNCEHLIEACAKVAEMLLNNALELKILTTSREALGVPGEVIWQVPTLSLPNVEHLPVIEQLSQFEAVQLFIERATLVQPHFHVTNDNAPAVAQICFRLDGIPLAIELVAARVRTLGVDQIHKRLDDRFHLLTRGSRMTLERHQTLRATIDWSYNLLSENEKILFRRLAVFVGGWTLEAAEHIYAGSNISSKDVIDLLTHLVDKSLVILDASRYRMLETTRQYAHEKLLEFGEVRPLRDQHLAYFLDLTEQADRETDFEERLILRTRLRLDDNNFRAALEWCILEKKTDGGLQLLTAVKRWSGYHFSNIQTWFDSVHELPDVKKYPALYGKLLNSMAGTSWLRGNIRYAKSLVEESLPLWLSLGVDGELGLADAWTLQGEIAIGNEKDNQSAQSFLEQSLFLYEKHGNEGGMARAMFALGHNFLFAGHYTEAEKQFIKSGIIWKKIGDNYGEGFVFNELGISAQLQGNYLRAYQLYEQAAKIFHEIDGGSTLPISTLNLAWMSLRVGKNLDAEMRFKNCMDFFDEDGDHFGMIFCLAGLAAVLEINGKFEDAARLFSAFETLIENVGSSLDPAEQKEVNHYITIVHEELDEGIFEKAWAQGSEMTLEQAIAFALEKTKE